jgi:hypothetical protein
MGLTSYSATQANPEGLLGVARYLQPADHESLFLPVYPFVTAEMQGQMASFIASGGTFVQVNNPALLLPVATVEAAKADEGKSDSKTGDGISRIEPAKPATNRGVNNHD